MLDIYDFMQDSARVWALSKGFGQFAAYQYAAWYRQAFTDDAEIATLSHETTYNDWRGVLAS